MTLFTVGDVINHRRGDLQCPECASEYPESCPCGGLMHASDSVEEDPDGNVPLVTLCDECGRSEGELESR
jgi:hypothetical protein